MTDWKIFSIFLIEMAFLLKPSVANISPRRFHITKAAIAYKIRNRLNLIKVDVCRRVLGLLPLAYRRRVNQISSYYLLAILTLATVMTSFGAIELNSLLSKAVY